MQEFPFYVEQSHTGWWLVKARGRDEVTACADYHLALKVAWRMNREAPLGCLAAARPALLDDSKPVAGATGPSGGNRVPLVPPAPILPGGDKLAAPAPTCAHGVPLVSGVPCHARMKPTSPGLASPEDQATIQRAYAPKATPRPVPAPVDLPF